MVSLASDFGIHLQATAKSDSTAAIGIAHRDGLGGRCCHIKVQYLWIQHRVRAGELAVEKVLGTENPADLMTKALAKESLEKYVHMLGFQLAAGRSAISFT